MVRWPSALTSASTVIWAKAASTSPVNRFANRRPGYADYIRRTSGFFPLPPKKPQDGGDPKD